MMESTVRLADIAETKVQMKELREKIQALEEEHGIIDLRGQLVELESSYKDQISEAVSKGLFEEDHFQLINKSRVMTVITPKLLFERYPDIFWSTVKVGKGATEEQLLCYLEEQGSDNAKKAVASIINEMSTKSQSNSTYELIDLLSGD